MNASRIVNLLLIEGAGRSSLGCLSGKRVRYRLPSLDSLSGEPEQCHMQLVPEALHREGHF